LNTISGLDDFGNLLMAKLPIVAAHIVEVDIHSEIGIPDTVEEHIGYEMVA
jgi:hypothetical protein